MFDCGFCLDREHVVDITFAVAAAVSEYKEEKLNEKKKLLYKLLVFRFAIAMILNIVAAHYALFSATVTYVGLIFFELYVMSYTYAVGLMAYKLWHLRAPALYFFVYLSLLKTYEIICQIVTLALLAKADKVFSGGFDTFLNAYSITDIILDGLQVLMYCVNCFHLDDNVVHAEGEDQEEVNTECGCITYV